MELQLKKWQQVAVERSNRPISGIFLEARGGKGKTIGALAIAEHKNAKRVMILNNQKNILDGWKNTIEEHFSNSDIEFIIETDKWLDNHLKKLKQAENDRSTLKKNYNNNRKMYTKHPDYKKLQSLIKELKSPLTVDVLIIDEWQNMCSDKNVKNYTKVKRDYSIGLSATPIREKGQNFFPLEKTFFGKAQPSQKVQWVKYHGLMLYDAYSYTKETWTDFRDYESYISRLDEQCNFMRWEYINELDQTKENNGFKVKLYRPKVALPKENVEKLRQMKKYNVVEVDGKFAMPKQKFGSDSFERYLRQSVIEVNFPKLQPKDEFSPLMEMLYQFIGRDTEGMLIGGSSKKIINLLYEQNKDRGLNVGLWTGDAKINVENCQILFATTQKVGVGVDGFQHRFKTVVALDPVFDEKSGYYNDYLQFKWRVIGDRQQHDVNLVEIVYLTDPENGKTSLDTD